MQRVKVLKMDVNVGDICDAVHEILLWRTKSPAVGRYVCVSNVHMCMEVASSEVFASVVNQADLVVPDGRPIYWALRLLGYKRAAQIRGQDLMLALLRSGETKGFTVRVGLYGGDSPKILSAVKGKLQEEFPRAAIVYSYSPPKFEVGERPSPAVIKEINSAEVDLLFVGVGCPKQEYWMAQLRESLSCSMVGVGAAFDFIAGNKRHAPHWMQKTGLEWLFRLCSEPTRLWKRYLKQNPRFIYHFLIQYVNVKLLNRRNSHV